MKRDKGVLGSTALMVVLLSVPAWAQAQERPTSYPSMAPVNQYLISDRNAEIAMARSAAPDAISRDAKVLVLGRQGYETAVEGKNGFVCVVERSWMAPFDNPEFWNPKIRGPVCFNPPAAKSILPMTYKRTEMTLAGKSKVQILDASKEAFDKKELPALEPGAMSYMMSKAAYLTDRDDHNVAHLMFYTPAMDGAIWGADLPNSPVMSNPQFKGAQPVNVFIVPVGRWSDGTAAPVM
ncbi:MAG TPA: hypothetical protein VEH30_08050 [Terriglobales bacterium]|nr:hypothetical protein [Terriglobales bacterium]